MNKNLQTKISEIFHQNPSLSSLVDEIKRARQSFWLVGGCLRDLMLDRDITDIDIVSSEDPTAFARSWAAKVHGRWFWLDSGRFHSRVLLNSKIHVDFSPLRAETIKKDLELRDFTINAFALLLESEITQRQLLDPLKGQADLQKKVLRLCSPQSFSDDPLRMLKGIRHAVTLNLTCAASTLTLMRQSSHLLSSVAGERIREEFLRILSSEYPVRGLELLDESGLIKELLGSPGETWNRSSAFEKLSDFQDKLGRLKRTIERFPSEDNRPDTSLFLFVKLLEEYSPVNLPETMHKTLRFSRAEQQLIGQLLNNGSEFEDTFPLQESAQSPRVKALTVEVLEPRSFEKMLYWGVCPERITLGQALELYQSYRSEQKCGRIPDLLNGQEIEKITCQRSGPKIGVWQKKLKHAEIKGNISTKAEAADWLKNQITI